MKKNLFLILIILLGGMLKASVPGTVPSNPFQDDLSQVDVLFSDMTELEKVVEASHSTYSELAASNNPLLNSVTSEKDISAFFLYGMEPDNGWMPGLPGFLLGFFLGWIGVLIAYVVFEGEARKKETRAAWIGCMVVNIIALIIILAALSTGDWFQLDWNWNNNGG